MNVQCLDAKEYEEIKKGEEERLRKAREERDKKIDPEKNKRKLQKERAKKELLGTKSEKKAKIQGGQGNKSSIGKRFMAFVVIMGILVLGYWGLAHGVGDIFQTQKFAPPPSQTSTSQSSIVSETSIQKTIDSFEFVSIPAGEFEMGSPSSEAGRYDNEGPVHRVKISNAFYMGKYEVTQKQWRDVMGTNPSYFKGDNLPIELVSWNDAQEFIQKLNEKEGNNKYRLPSEAEWEYTARAGTTTSFSFGDDVSKLGDYAWYTENSGSKTHDVGQKKPNPWGLYDMHGNVWEWVQDKYQSNYNGAPTDGSVYESGGSYRVVRGGSWLYHTRDCRLAFRGYRVPDFRDFNLGFRLLRIS